MTETAAPLADTATLPVRLPPDSKWRLGPPPTPVSPSSSALILARGSAVTAEKKVIEARKPVDQTLRGSHIRGAADARPAPPDETEEQYTSATGDRPDPLPSPGAQVECTASKPQEMKEPLSLVVSCKALGKCLTLVSNDEERVAFLLALSRQARVEPCAEADKYGARYVFPCADS